MDTGPVLNDGKNDTEEKLWESIISRQGELFYTAKKLPFTYEIRGGEMFVDRRSKSITKATIMKAYLRIREDTDHLIRGPKKLNCFGAPYVWAIFMALGIVSTNQKQTPVHRPCMGGTEETEI